MQATYNMEQSGNERLSNRLEVVLEENRELLRILATDFDRVKAVVGSEQENTVINRAKQQEQIEAERKRAARRENIIEKHAERRRANKSPLSCHEVNQHQLVKSGVAVQFTLDWLVGLYYFY